MSRNITRRTALGLVSAAALAPLAAPRIARAATTHDVKMLNVHPDMPRLRMVFLPRLLVVQPGDTVRFLPTDPGHNSASLDEMIPEGAEGWKGAFNKEVAVTLERPGFYGYVCTPHVALGMVGLVVVQGDGMMDNYEAARGVAHRGRAAAVFDEIWEEVAEQGLVS
ncbi:pseudoazurin [Salinarimonas sp.]|uniref:pseudoazurin n=1 Tax=Salinarimonas sp. TaxID=2766526 RepID=UPI0032D8EF7C